MKRRSRACVSYPSTNKKEKPKGVLTSLFPALGRRVFTGQQTRGVAAGASAGGDRTNPSCSPIQL